MKVVLNENVKGLGKKLDIVNVSEGYARNFLFPKKLATPADNKSVSEATTKKSAIQFKKDTDRENAQELKAKIEEIIVDFKVKTADNGKLFGSVTSKEISDELKKTSGIDVDKKKITLDDSIKTTGVYTAKVKLYEGVIANLKVRVSNI
jgi:large subunit ribosomal protein L9